MEYQTEHWYTHTHTQMSKKRCTYWYTQTDTYTRLLYKEGNYDETIIWYNTVGQRGSTWNMNWHQWNKGNDYSFALSVLLPLFSLYLSLFMDSIRLCPTLHQQPAEVFRGTEYGSDCLVLSHPTTEKEMCTMTIMKYQVARQKLLFWLYQSILENIGNFRVFNKKVQ